VLEQFENPVTKSGKEQDCANKTSLHSKIVYGNACTKPRIGAFMYVCVICILFDLALSPIL
jgi:hypothetical protein